MHIINYGLPGLNCFRHIIISLDFFPIILQKIFLNFTLDKNIYMYKENKKIDNKIRSLMEKDFKNKLQNIKSIRYNIPSGKDESINIIINISPKKFSVSNSLDTIQDKWFINMSDVEFPLEVQRLPIRRSFWPSSNFVRTPNKKEHN